MPGFDLGDGGVTLAVIRFAFVTALFISYGSLLYRVRLAPASIAVRLDQLIHAALIVTLAAGVLWLVWQARVLLPDDRLGTALQDTLLTTRFGHVLIVQFAAVVLALGLSIAARWNEAARDLALGLAGLAVVVQVGHEHAASMYEGVSILLISVILHLLAGAAWLGSLPALLLTIALSPMPQARAAAARYASFGTWCVRLLVLTALFQGWQLVGSVAGLVGTAYGLTILAKTALFCALLVLAANNRFRLTPRLEGKNGAVGKVKLVRSIGLETLVGLALLAAAALLVSLPPAIHEQPLWPFGWMPSLATVHEDPAFLHEVLLAGLAILAGIAILIASLVKQRFRLPAGAAAVIILWFAVPHLALLLVPAYPTSYYRSPTRFAATSIAHGAGLFADHCASCHGPKGRGDGPIADGLEIPPADLTASHLWAHGDGELFWWLTSGIPGPDGKPAMPGFGGELSDSDRWNLIDFIRANNAGRNHLVGGAGPVPVQAPWFQAMCGGVATPFEALPGEVRHIIFAPDIPPPTANTSITILVDPNAQTGKGFCTAADPSIARAYAIIAGIEPEKLAGTEFLVDGNGWLRAIRRPGEPGLEQLIDEISQHPLEATAAPMHHHHPQ